MILMLAGIVIGVVLAFVGFTAWLSWVDAERDMGVYLRRYLLTREG